MCCSDVVCGHAARRGGGWQVVLESTRPALLAALVPGLGDASEPIGFVTEEITAIMREAAAE